MKINTRKGLLPLIFSLLQLSAALAQSEEMTAETVPQPKESIVIPVGSQGDAQSAVEMPSRGQKQDAVLNHYGEPRARLAAVGNPPISRWEYADFVVYFENDTVIHSVLIHHSSSSIDSQN